MNRILRAVIVLSLCLLAVSCSDPMGGGTRLLNPPEWAIGIWDSWQDVGLSIPTRWAMLIEDDHIEVSRDRMPMVDYFPDSRYEKYGFAEEYPDEDTYILRIGNGTELIISNLGGGLILVDGNWPLSYGYTGVEGDFSRADSFAKGFYFPDWAYGVWEGSAENADGSVIDLQIVVALSNLWIMNAETGEEYLDLIADSGLSYKIYSYIDKEGWRCESDSVLVDLVLLEDGTGNTIEVKGNWRYGEGTMEIEEGTIFSKVQ